ncbi:MAG: sporulation protein YunB [Firmicutes bacterium]|nr:sporulation protein YunB [[Eubacterium] siraeum]MCM1488027.1 sporulation protein YunB [Bacillota bacterium]
MTNYSKRKNKIGLRLLAFILIIGGILLLIDIRIRPIIEQTAIYQSKILATRIINEAVYSQLDDRDFKYDGLITLTFGDDNSVSSIESNMVNINKLKAKINNSVNEQLSKIDQYDLSVAMGTVSGFYSFYNQGPLIPIKVLPEGYVETLLISSFESAGINQTLHRILVDIKVDISAIIPGYTASGTVHTQYVIAETVIVGSVPNAYTHVISGSEDIVGEINDYGAQ